MSKFRTLVLVASAYALSGCVASEAAAPSRSELAVGSQDEMLSGELCRNADQPEDCDLCETYELYGDGVCDVWCPEADSDCTDPAFKATVAAAFSDPDESNRLCEAVDLPNGCDLCGARAYGFYDDAVCDSFCPVLDPDCAQSCIADGDTCPTGTSCRAREYDSVSGEPVAESLACLLIECGAFVGEEEPCPTGTQCQLVADDCPEGLLDCGRSICVATDAEPEPEPAPEHVCGGLAGNTCPEGTMCVFHEEDCPPGQLDCYGRCETQKVACGFAAPGVMCPEGTTCQDDPDDACDPMTALDCPAICR